MSKSWQHLRESSTRLWVILARKAPVAVIFRRGPSRQVQLIKWNLNDDTFEPGQWFEGRVYERRCDLSPAGTLLIYFAATYKKPLRSWTAVSKPPWFTALALWPKGDGWNGGGHFVDAYRIHLDHFPGDDAPHPDFVRNCRRLRITSLSGIRGEDGPVWHTTLQRDGWTQTHPGIWSENSRKRAISFQAEPPERWQETHRSRPLKLEMLIEGIGQENGSMYLTRFRVIDDSHTEIADLGPTDWADWDKQGDLLFARTGCIYRQRFSTSGPRPVKLLADFRSNKFEAIAPPRWATTF